MADVKALIKTFYLTSYLVEGYTTNTKCQVLVF